MALITDEVLKEISIIIGDIADQWTEDGCRLKSAYELKNTLLWLTSENIFGWNIREEALTSASGVITPTYSFAKILQICDSNKNINYQGATFEEFYLRKRNTNFLYKYDSSATIPFLVSVDRTTGAESIVLPEMDPTDWYSSLTFYVTYTEPTTFDGTPTGTIDVWIPERLRPYVVSRTAAILLAKLENPDKELISTHIQLAEANLQQELVYTTSRHINRFNANIMLSNNTAVNLNSSGGI